MTDTDSAPGRSKSPSYPNFSLRKAIQYAEAAFAADRRNPMHRADLAKHMGYSSLSGAADKSLSTMLQYGLTEKVAKGEVRVSQLAVDIMHPDKPADRTRALLRAAFTPPLFKDLKDRFPDDVFSEGNLRSYLMREGFLDRAIGPVYSAYSDTVAFLKQEKAYESGGGGVSEYSQSDSPNNDDKPVFGGAAVGDLVQWEREGVLQLDAPMRVRAVHDDGAWLWVEGSNTGIPMSEVIVEQKGASIVPLPPPPPPAESPLLAAMMDRAKKAATPGMRQEVFALDEGDVTLTFPDGLSLDSYADLEDYLALFLKKAKRRASKKDEDSAEV